MSTSVSATKVEFDQDSMWVTLTDGRVLGVPLAWFPRLLRATPDSFSQSESPAAVSTGKLLMKTSRSRACLPDKSL
jgi:hypothetical protein